MDAAWELGLAHVRHGRRVRRRAQRAVDRGLAARDAATGRGSPRRRSTRWRTAPTAGSRASACCARSRRASSGSVSTASTSTSPHEPDPDTPRRGDVRRVRGAARARARSAPGASATSRARDLREWLELGTPALVQNSYSLLDRGDEAELIPLCARARDPVPGVQPARRRLADRQVPARRGAPAGLADDHAARALPPPETDASSTRSRRWSARPPSAASAWPGSRSPGRSAAASSVVVGPAAAGAPRARARGTRRSSSPPAERDEVGSALPMLILTAKRSCSSSTCRAALPRWRRHSSRSRAASSTCRSARSCDRPGSRIARADADVPLGRPPAVRAEDRRSLPRTTRAGTRSTPGHGHALRRRRPARSSR